MIIITTWTIYCIHIYIYKPHPNPSATHGNASSPSALSDRSRTFCKSERYVDGALEEHTEITGKGDRVRVRDLFSNSDITLINQFMHSFKEQQRLL